MTCSLTPLFNFPSRCSSQFDNKNKIPKLHQSLIRLEKKNPGKGTERDRKHTDIGRRLSACKRSNGTETEFLIWRVSRDRGRRHDAVGIVGADGVGKLQSGPSSLFPSGEGVSERGLVWKQGVERAARWISLALSAFEWIYPGPPLYFFPEIFFFLSIIFSDKYYCVEQWSSSMPVPCQTSAGPIVTLLLVIIDIVSRKLASSYIGIVHFPHENFQVFL